MSQFLQIAARIVMLGLAVPAIAACTADRTVAPDAGLEPKARLSGGPSCQAALGNITAIVLAPSARTAQPGESWRYSAVNQNGQAIEPCALIWTSSNASQVRVSATGTATAVSVGGPVTITASTDLSNSIRGTASVRVIPNVSTGLLAYYPFRESARDASGRGRNGLVVGSVVLAPDRFGKAQGAYAFSGGYIDIGCLGFDGNFSFSAWININEPRPGGFAVLSNLNGLGYEFIAVTCDDTNFEESVLQCTSPDSDYLRLHTNLSPCCTLTNTITAASAPLLGGRWHHVASTYAAATGTASLYVDGQLVKQRSGMAATRPSGVNTRIGQSGYGGNPFFGLIDEVRVYSRTLSAAEVAYLVTIP